MSEQTILAHTLVYSSVPLTLTSQPHPPPLSARPTPASPSQFSQHPLSPFQFSLSYAFLPGPNLGGAWPSTAQQETGHLLSILVRQGSDMDNKIGPTDHLGFKATMSRSLGTPGTRGWGNSWQEGGMEAGGVGDWRQLVFIFSEQYGEDQCH